METQKKETELLPVVAASTNHTAFSNYPAFVEAQKMAQALAQSKLVPKIYQNSIADSVIALEMAQRMGAGILAVMQSLHVIHGKPGWSAAFIIACLNASGRFSPIRYKIKENGKKTVKSQFSTYNEQARKKKISYKDVTIEDVVVRAYAYEKGSGEEIEGPPVSLEMAHAEGWYNKSGSKWVTMPELMLRYRAATFFGRLYAPDILMGMQTMEEINDVADYQVVDIDKADITTKPSNRTAAKKEPKKPGDGKEKESSSTADQVVNQGAALDLEIKTGKPEVKLPAVEEKTVTTQDQVNVDVYLTKAETSDDNYAPLPHWYIDEKGKVKNHQSYDFFMNNVKAFKKSGPLNTFWTQNYRQMKVNFAQEQYKTLLEAKKARVLQLQSWEEEVKKQAAQDAAQEHIQTPEKEQEQKAVFCPNGNGNVFPDFCESNCEMRIGCPALEGQEK